MGEIMQTTPRSQLQPAPALRFRGRTEKGPVEYWPEEEYQGPSDAPEIQTDKRPCSGAKLLAAEDWT